MGYLVILWFCVNLGKFYFSRNLLHLLTLLYLKVFVNNCYCYNNMPLLSINMYEIFSDIPFLSWFWCFVFSLFLSMELSIFLVFTRTCFSLCYFSLSFDFYFVDFCSFIYLFFHSPNYFWFTFFFFLFFNFLIWNPRTSILGLSSSLIWVFKALHFLLRTAFTGSHRFWYVVLLLSFSK